MNHSELNSDEQSKVLRFLHNNDREDAVGIISVSREYDKDRTIIWFRSNVLSHITNKRQDFFATEKSLVEILED